VEITRRGKPVAVLLSLREFQRLNSPEKRFWSAYEAFRDTFDLASLAITPEIFDGLRDQSPGREVEF